MNEIIMQVARSLACSARLKILSCLAADENISPTDLSRHLHMALPVVCAHLRRLSASGLIQRRHSGIWCYAVARSPYSQQAFSGRLASWLFSILKQPQQHVPPQDPPDRPGGRAADAEGRLHAIIFSAATAFTNMRRLQILHYVAGHGTVGAEKLAGALKMSRAALSRHGPKLVRRGYLQAVREGGFVRYRLAHTHQTAIHAHLWMLVRAEWRKKRIPQLANSGISSSSAHPGAGSPPQQQ
jgi:DNA-binding transcriptional ArsR family regulator